MQTTTIDLPGGFAVACDHRLRDGAPTIVFVHGFGSAREHFGQAFAAAPLARHGLVAMDLVGFGDSRGPDDFDYAMRSQADILLRALDRLRIDRFHLVAHSMGGLVAIEAAEAAPERVLSLVDLEGNLTPEDCFFSGKIAAQPLERFAAGGRRGFQAALDRAGRDDPGMREYAGTFARAATDALHRSAVHTVADSAGPLADRLARLPRACYVYGEKNRGVFPGEALLAERGVPVFWVACAGHAMAVENPEGLYRVVGDFIKE